MDTQEQERWLQVLNGMTPEQRQALATIVIDLQRSGDFGALAVVDRIRQSVAERLGAYLNGEE